MSRVGILIGIAAIAIAILLALRLIPAIKTTIAEPEPQKQFVQTSSLSDLGLHNWHEYSAPNKFKVLFPTLPQHATEKIEDPKTKVPRQYEMYVSEKDNGTIFMITMSTALDASQKEESEEKMLTNVMNNMLTESPQGKLKNMKTGKFHEYPSLDFAIEKDNVSIDGKAFIVGKTLYLISSVAKIENLKPQEFEFFLNSFELLPSDVAPAK